SYEARRFGIHSAMPMSRARRRCPDLVVVPPDHRRYREVSEEVFAVFHSFTPLVEGLSLDEAFLDVGGLRRHYPSPVVVAEHIRAALRRALGLPASVGVAPSKFLAKLASEAAKPDGIRHVPVSAQLEFLHALPVRALWGVGEATLAVLDGLGVETVGDIATLGPSVLERRLGAAVGRHIFELAQGRDDRAVEPDIDAKSLSVEQTYEVDLRGWTMVDSELLAHADRLASRLRRAGLLARTISLKLRYSDFTTLTRSETSPAGTDITRELHHIGRRLAHRLDVDRPIRLLGLGATNLAPKLAPRQLRVGDTGEWDRVADAVEAVRERFGQDSIEPAGLMNPIREK
ncbi:MAG: DNA polymerase IV, partial [Acidimicrobiia bacterium]